MEAVTTTIRLGQTPNRHSSLTYVVAANGSTRRGGCDGAGQPTRQGGGSQMDGPIPLGLDSPPSPPRTQLVARSGDPVVVATRKPLVNGLGGQSNASALASRWRPAPPSTTSRIRTVWSRGCGRRRSRRRRRGSSQASCGARAGETRPHGGIPSPRSGLRPLNILARYIGPGTDTPLCDKQWGKLRETSNPYPDHIPRNLLQSIVEYPQDDGGWGDGPTIAAPLRSAR